MNYAKPMRAPWQKHLARLPLTPLESLITDVIVAHPEYQILVADTQSVLAFEANAEGSAENPFLHMGLHLAVNEQLSIDRPPGIRTLYQHLQAVCEDAHRCGACPHGMLGRDALVGAAQWPSAGRKTLYGAGARAPRPPTGWPQRLTKLHRRPRSRVLY